MHIEKSKENAEKTQKVRTLLEPVLKVYEKISLLRYREVFDALLEPSIRTSSILTIERIFNQINL